MQPTSDDSLVLWLGLHLLFNFHIVEFVSVEHFATQLAFNKLDVVFARYYAHLEVLAGGIHGERAMDCIHRYGQNCTLAACDTKAP